MMRPSTRRRPTALRLTETDQKYVLTASLSTFAAFAVSAYAFHYSRTGSTNVRYVTLDAVLCAGLVLVGSSLQKHFYPIDGVKRSAEARADLLPELNSKVMLGVAANAIGMVAKFSAFETLGAGRCIALILPFDISYRAYRGGFYRGGTMTSGLIASAMLLGLISDFVAPAALFTSTTDLIFGYASILVSMISTCTSINRQTDSGEYSIWAGFPLLLLALFSSMLGLGGISGNVVALLVSVTAGISALTWSATQPRAVSTTLTLTWPLTMVCAGFLSLNILHDMTVLQAASGILLYIGVFQSVQSSGIASSSQTAANVLPSNKISKFGGYYINEILKDKESRDIFYFLLLNLSFMVVQMLYGIWTNSLGLISDSIHMFFDCLALAVGLVAAVMSKWPASRSHPFGFAKVEIISGFANGIFLVLISISIMIEAVERLLEPPEMKTDQLLLVSTLGLGVNLVGIFAFNHGHHHGHSHGHSHGHDLSHETKKTPEPLPTIHTPRTSRHDSSFDHVMGLQSPAPEFSGFDQDRRASLVGLGLGDGLGELKEHVLPLPNGHSGYRDRSPNRARSPVRRPGSPLKFAHEPLLPDVTEDHELVAYGDSGTDLLESHSHPHDHDHDQPHGSGKTCHKSSQGGSEGSHSHAMIQNTTGHARDHSPDHSHNHTHSHKKSDSYDLTAGHTHDHDSCSGHAHSEPHSHGHDHSHNMEGIFLHILADTLGSAGVIVSTILIRYFGWTGFDPLASIFIAVLIFLSVIPLLKSSFSDLLLTLQNDQEYTLREVLGEVSLISGVSGIPFIRFWVDGQRKMHGILTIRAGIDGDTDVVRQKVKRRLHEGVPELVDVVVQVDREE